MLFTSELVREMPYFLNPTFSKAAQDIVNPLFYKAL